MISLGLDEGEPFWCAGNLYSMLIPRDVTKCFEAVLETVEPGRATPPNAHDTFAQLYVLLSGTGRLHVAEEVREVSTPSVAFIPQKTQHQSRTSATVPGSTST